jgi:hypothetical protein
LVTSRAVVTTPNESEGSLPGPPASARQEIGGQGVGFMWGTNTVTINQTSSLVDVFQASANAGSAGTRVGEPITAWAPSTLGVHDAITTHDTTNSQKLTAYVLRDHDRRLRDSLIRLTHPNARSNLVLVVGTSCAGKTRTLYEAIRAVLPTWQLIAPRTAADLTRSLEAGIPPSTVVWLDELQDRLTHTGEGPRAANYITELLFTTNDRARPILFAGTIWPSNLTHLSQRPDAAAAAAGAGAVAGLLKHAITIPVEDVFTREQLHAAKTSPDDRVRAAARAAAKTPMPNQGWEVTQVLAGGTALIDRLYPPEGQHVERPFSPAARAVLDAAADLRRIGMPNPIPRWALEGSAPSYLPSPTRPDHAWMPEAIEETTLDATRADPVINSRSHDHYRHGTPGLTPTWTTNPNIPEPTEGYVLHDYVAQDHFTRHYLDAPRDGLWACLITQSGLLDVHTVTLLAEEALSRGRFEIARQLVASHRKGSRETNEISRRLEQYRKGNFGPHSNPDEALVRRRNSQTLRDLWSQSALVDTNRQAGIYVGGPLVGAPRPGKHDPLIWQGHLADLADRGDEESLLTLGKKGDLPARGFLVDLYLRTSDTRSLRRLSRAGWTKATIALIRSDFELINARQLDERGRVVPWGS